MFDSIKLKISLFFLQVSSVIAFIKLKLVELLDGKVQGSNGTSPRKQNVTKTSQKPKKAKAKTKSKAKSARTKVAVRVK